MDGEFGWESKGGHTVRQVKLYVTALELLSTDIPEYILQTLERTAYERLGTIRQESTIRWMIDVPSYLPSVAEFQDIPGLALEYTSAVFYVEVKTDDAVRV
jgi:hypothetical protein